MRTLTSSLALVLLLVLAVPVRANTRFGFGTITDVDETGERNRKKTPGFTVCYEWFNLSGTAVLKGTFYKFEERTRHGHRVYFLDGQPSTWKEALQVGRAICVSDNEMVCWVSSKPGPQAEVPPPTRADCWLELTLKNGFGAKLAKVNKGTVGEMKDEGSEVLLLVDIRGGAIAGAAASLPRLSGTDFALDHSQLTYADGKLGGSFSISVPFPEGGSYRLEQGTEVVLSCTVEASVGEDGAVTGTFTGTCGGREKAESISGRSHGRKDRADPCRVWLQFWDMGGHKFYYAIVPVAGGAGQPGGDFLYSKGNREGGIPTLELKVAGNRVTGSLEIDGSKPHRVTVDAVIIGDRLLFGSWTEEGRTSPLRGGIVPGVEDGPQIRGCDGEQKTIMRELQRKLYPDDPSYQPKG